MNLSYIYGRIVFVESHFMRILFYLSQFIFIYFVAVVPGYGRDRGDDLRMHICGNWEMNETRTYSIKESCKKFSGDQKLCEETTEYDAVISVDSIVADGYVFSWKFKNIKVLAPNLVLQKMGEVCDGLEILYKTDNDGTFIEILNYKEIYDCICKSLCMLAKNYAKTPAVEAVLEQLRACFSTREAMEDTFLNEIKLFHSLHGENISSSTSKEYKKRVPNLFGGTPFPGICSIELEDFDNTSKICKVAVNHFIDEEQAQNNIYRYLKKLSRRMAHALPSKEDIPQIQINDSSSISINLLSGWLVAATNNELISTGPIQQIMHTEINQKY